MYDNFFCNSPKAFSWLIYLLMSLLLHLYVTITKKKKHTIGRYLLE